MERRRIYDGFYALDVVETPAGPREIVTTPDAVSLLVHDVDQERLLFVRQSRIPPITDANPDGLITETIAGRLDDGETPRSQMVREAQEEAGITLTEDDIELLNDGQPLYISCGLTTERCTLGYVRVRTAQIAPEREFFGVPSEGERIQRVWIPVAESDRLVPCDDLRVFTLVQWFHTRHGR